MTVFEVLGNFRLFIVRGLFRLALQFAFSRFNIISYGCFLLIENLVRFFRFASTVLLGSRHAHILRLAAESTHKSRCCALWLLKL